MTWDTFFMVYGVIAAMVLAVMWVMIPHVDPDDEGFGYEATLASLFWLPALVLVLLAWGWLTLDEVLTAEDDR